MSREIITVVVVLMLLLAGCSTSTAPPASPSENTSVEISNSSPEDKSRENSNPSQSSDVTSETTTVDEVEAIQVGELTEDSQPITDETRQTMETLSRDFYQELPTNETQRKAETVQAAQTLCSNSDNIDSSVFDTASEFNRQSYRLDHATSTVNEYFNKQISTDRLRSAMSGVGQISKFTPLVGSYNRMYDAACAVDRNDNQSIEQFYMASAAFGIEAALVQQQVFFKSSFAATRYTANRLSLMKLRTVTGNRGYGLLLSEVHWAYRGSQAKATSYVFEKSAELDLNVSDADRDTLSTAADEQFEKYRANASRSIDTARDGAENTTQIVEECAAQSRAEESDTIWNQARDQINDITGDLRSGLQNVSEVEPSDIPEDVNESIDRPDEFTSCVEDRLEE